MTIPVRIDKVREHTHQFTKIQFALNQGHYIKIELIAGILGGLFSTKFILEVDGKKLYEKELYTFFIQHMRHSFLVENIECSIKYTWYSGVWQGHVFVDGIAVV